MKDLEKVTVSLRISPVWTQSGKVVPPQRELSEAILSYRDISNLTVVQYSKIVDDLNYSLKKLGLFGELELKVIGKKAVE